MQVAIIGTGNVGKALGTSLVRAGHSVVYAAQDHAKSAQVAREIGATAADDVAAAAKDADIVIVAVPYRTVDSVIEALAPVVAGKVVIDSTNPLKADFSGLATDGGPSAAERFAARLPGATLVKAFNTLFATIQADPNHHGTAAQALFATDAEGDARTGLAELIASMGFKPIDAGSLAAARQLEALAWLNISMQLRFGGDWRTAFVLVGAPAAAVA